MELYINDKLKLLKFANIFQNLKLITEDVKLDFTEKGMYCQALGSNHVCLVELMILAEWFSDYTIEKNISLGINCEVFHSIFTCLEKNNTFKMKYEDCNDTLDIIIKSANVEKNFNMRLMMIESGLLDIPSIEYSADIIIESKSFADYINELFMFGDELIICCDGKNNDNIIIETAGDNGKLQMIIEEDYLEEYSVEEDITLKMTYAMEYIKKMTNFVKLSKYCELHISKDVPLKMLYKLDDNESNYLSIFLAPKVEDD